MTAFRQWQAALHAATPAQRSSMDVADMHRWIALRYPGRTFIMTGHGHNPEDPFIPWCGHDYIMVRADKLTDAARVEAQLERVRLLRAHVYDDTTALLSAALGRAAEQGYTGIHGDAGGWCLRVGRGSPDGIVWTDRHYNRGTSLEDLETAARWARHREREARAGRLHRALWGMLAHHLSVEHWRRWDAYVAAGQRITEGHNPFVSLFHITQDGARMYCVTGRSTGKRGSGFTVDMQRIERAPVIGAPGSAQPAAGLAAL